MVAYLLGIRLAGRLGKSDKFNLPRTTLCANLCSPIVFLCTVSVETDSDLPADLYAEGHLGCGDE